MSSSCDDTAFLICAEAVHDAGAHKHQDHQHQAEGCTPAQTFQKVTLPLSMPGILSGITMVFVPEVSTFYISQKLGGTDTVLIGDVIERLFKQGNNANLGAALSLVLMILVFVCTGIMNRFGGDEEGVVV